MLSRRVASLALTVVVTTLAVLLVGAAGPAAADDPPAPPGTPTAATVAPDPVVGPLFRGALADGHECTGSVVASPTHDLVLTAAHCVFGDPAGWLFVPGYDRGATPYGVWTVTGAYVDPRWQRGDTRYDYALLRVAPQRVDGRRTALQTVTGAAVLGAAPAPGRTITDVAYNAGVDDDPIACTTTAYRTAGYPAFDCHGYVGGSSGSPWFVRGGAGARTVVGVIGGLHQGGCYEYTSYSSPFTSRVYALWLRAVLHAPTDTVVDPGGDGC